MTLKQHACGVKAYFGKQLKTYKVIIDHMLSSSHLRST